MQFRKKRGKLIILWSALAAVFILIIARALICNSTMAISIDAADVDHIVCNSRGAGPKRLDYLDNQSAINDLCDMLSGEYDRMRKLNVRGRDGGSPSWICFYDDTGREIVTIYYHNGYVCTEGKVQGIYTTYQCRDHVLSFSFLENLLN